MKSPAFSSFRELMDIWDESENDLKIKTLIDTNKLMLFFKKDGKLYGAPESSRLVFARMKTPDEDLPDGWEDEASFVAFDLAAALKGEKVQSVFSAKDLDAIKVIDQEKAEKILASKDCDKVADLETDDDMPTAPDAVPTVAKIGEA